MATWVAVWSAGEEDLYSLVRTAERVLYVQVATAMPWQIFLEQSGNIGSRDRAEIELG